MQLFWDLRTADKTIPPHPVFESLKAAREFLERQGVTIQADKGWTLHEMKDEKEVTSCSASIVVSDQAKGLKSLLALPR
jgi:hypothetical protein